MTTLKNEIKKHYKKPLGQLKIEKFCSDNNNLIQNYISYLYKDIDYKIKLMTNDDATLDRNTHCGADICVETAASNDYYYITTSRKDYYCQNFLTINNNLLPLIKQATFNYKILLFNYGKIYRFDKWIFEDIKENDNGFVNVPLTEAENVYTYSNDDFRTPKKYINIKWDKLGYVRYSKKFDMHKKPITIVASEYRYKRTFDSEVKAYAALTGTKVENGRVVGKPVENAAYKKSYSQFRRDIKADSLFLINDSGKTFKATIFPNVVSSVGTEAPTEVTTSILVVNKSTTNIDLFTSEHDKDNIGKKVAKPRNSCYKKLDKQLDQLADKISEVICKKYSEKDIIANLLAFGSNKNMFEAYLLGLYEKGLYKEAEYANKMFVILNNNKIGD